MDCAELNGDRASQVTIASCGAAARSIGFSDLSVKPMRSSGSRRNRKDGCYLKRHRSRTLRHHKAILSFAKVGDFLSDLCLR